MGEVCTCESRDLSGTIVFATVGRSRYAFDVFAISVTGDLLHGRHRVGFSQKLDEQRLTDGISVNSNGHIVQGNSKKRVLKWIQRGGIATAADRKILEAASEDETELLVYVSEKDGSLQVFARLFVDQLKQHEVTPEVLLSNWDGLSDGSKRGQNLLLPKPFLGDWAGLRLQDRPQIAGERIVFMATDQGSFSATARQSWTAIFTLAFESPELVRLTPFGVSDFSPAISPSGKWVAVASLQGKGWQGEVQELETDIYVFRAADGSDRRLVTEHGGWPSWSDESTIFFHRKEQDGWWSVFRASLPEGFLTTGEGKIAVCRVTPKGIHAFTPSASQTGEWVAVATRRPDTDFRQIEIFDLRSRIFIKLTENINPYCHHFNPSVAPSSDKIIYHRCRGSDALGGGETINPRVEPLQCDVPGLALLRIDGSFPTMSHDGSTIVYTDDFQKLLVTKFNGEGKRTLFSNMSFATAWDWKRNGVVYTSTGGVFQSEAATVHIVAVFNGLYSQNSDDEPESKVLTKEGTGNNAFPSPSPDGKYVVFRSGRNGYKNLWIMDAINGEDGGIRQLTDGDWTDTMPNWSPTGEWIAFSSNRGMVEEQHFAGYLIRPDGSELRKILSDGGRVNHLCFSPDGKSLVFTSDFAAVSAEPISTPNQFQPYGDIHICAIDGSAIHRLTYNPYENGTPSWGFKYIDMSDLSRERGDPISCGFDDQRWLAVPGETTGIEVRTKAGPVWCSDMS